MELSPRTRDPIGQVLPTRTAIADAERILDSVSIGGPQDILQLTAPGSSPDDTLCAIQLLVAQRLIEERVGFYIGDPNDPYGRVYGLPLRRTQVKTRV